MFPEFSVGLHQIVADIMNICLGTLVPILLALGVRYANKRWGLNIQAEQQAQIESLEARMAFGSGTDIAPVQSQIMPFGMVSGCWHLLPCW